MADTIHFLKSTTSTNDVAAEWARTGAPHGSAVVADQQISGRGRLSRSWFSPPHKNLYCSIVIRPRIDHSDYPKLTLIAGLSVAEFLESRCNLNVDLKWPNDIYIAGKKCGGILCESTISEKSGDSFAIVGIGLNCLVEKDDLPQELKEIATSLVMNGCKNVQPRKLFEGLQEKLLDTIDEFEIKGFAPLLARWREHDFLYNKPMNWVNSQEELIYGKSLGLDEEGILHVRDSSGVIHEIISGDVTLGSE